MLRSKYGLQAIFGVGLLLFAIPQLPLEYSYDVQSIFAFLWVGVATLFIAANGRQMMKLGLFARLQKERKRRALWLEAQRHLPRRRRGRMI